MGLDSGKHGGAHGRHDRRDYYQSDYSDYSASSSRSENFKGTHKSVRFTEPAAVQTASAQPAALLELDKKLSGLQKDFAQQLQGISEKETEKFDLIFAILTDLQSGQAQLEESIRDIKKHVTGVQNMPLNQGQFSGNNSCTSFQYGQMDGVMGPQMSPEMGGQQIVVQPDGSEAVFMPMPQVMVMQSPPGGMMMQPMQPMQQQMVQFVGQSPVGQEMGAAFGGCEAVLSKGNAGGWPAHQVATGEQCADGGGGKVPLLPEPGKHEGSDVDSNDTPTTGISE